MNGHDHATDIALSHISMSKVCVSRWPHLFCIYLLLFNIASSENSQHFHNVPFYFCSGCFVNEERDFALLEGEVNESILFVNSVATEWFTKEYVPWWLPFLIHMCFNFLSDLNKLKITLALRRQKIKMMKLTSTPLVSNSCSSNMVLLTWIASSSISSGISAGQRTWA